jgi:hypothetical protein
MEDGRVREVMTVPPPTPPNIITAFCIKYSSCTGAGWIRTELLRLLQVIQHELFPPFLDAVLLQRLLAL